MTDQSTSPLAPPQTTNSDKIRQLGAGLRHFMREHIYPNEQTYFAQAERLGPWAVAPIIEDLKHKARAQGLWNLFLPLDRSGAGLTNVDYAPLCEIMGRSLMAPEIFNCAAPDTGNMEVLARFGSPQQRREWLDPLLAGEIRSAFAMTEPEAASSDATNIGCSITRHAEEYVIDGRKWYTTGATDPRCKIIILMGRNPDASADRHHRHSMILVPRETPGVTVVRSLPIFGFYGVPDRASEVWFDRVRVPAANILLGEGRGFEIAQGRLGPGRIHHCMRLIGLSERALERMCRRAAQRVAFGHPLAAQSVSAERIAESRVMIDQARLLTLQAAKLMDSAGNKAARREIAMIKIAAPAMACRVIDWAIQMFGGGGTGNDHFLASAYAMARVLRIADGPDEVHRNQLARLEIQRHMQTDPADTGSDADVLTREQARDIAVNALWTKPARWPSDKS